MTVFMTPAKRVENGLAYKGSNSFTGTCNTLEIRKSNLRLGNSVPRSILLIQLTETPISSASRSWVLSLTRRMYRRCFPMRAASE